MEVNKKTSTLAKITSRWLGCGNAGSSGSSLAGGPALSPGRSSSEPDPNSPLGLNDLPTGRGHAEMVQQRSGSGMGRDDSRPSKGRISPTAHLSWNEEARRPWRGLGTRTIPFPGLVPGGTSPWAGRDGPAGLTYATDQRRTWGLLSRHACVIGARGAAAGHWSEGINRPMGLLPTAAAFHGLRPDQGHRDSARGNCQSPYGLEALSGPARWPACGRQPGWGGTERCRMGDGGQVPVGFPCSVQLPPPVTHGGPNGPSPWAKRPPYGS